MSERPSRNYASAGASVGVRNRRLAVALVGVIAMMGGLAYASVPLYRLFCQVTGFAGTTQVSEAAPGAPAGGERQITVRFNSDISPKLNWVFAPEQKEITVKVGESALAFFRAQNRSDITTTGTAAFNVTPMKVGKYFNKVDCFCFDEQSLMPGEDVDMPVTFFIDPAIMSDPNMSEVKTITLSYTFFQAEDAGKRDEPLRQVGELKLPGSAVSVN